MKRCVIAAAALLAAAPLDMAQAAELVIRFPDVKAVGRLSVAVFDAPETWARRAAPVASAKPEVTGAQVTVRLDLPPGRYAIMAYHDRDGNGRLDTLAIGLPKEPYGFSNNSRGVFGPPAWRAAAFDLPAAGGVQVIRLR